MSSRQSTEASELSPMSRIFLSKADVSSIEEQYVLDALRSGWVTPLGPHVDAFEAEIAERVGVAGALALSSGTAALHLALLGLGAKPGAVVVLPSMTFVASANAVLYTGATPVFVDSQTIDGNIEPQLLIDAVDELIAEGQPIAAVMTVDLFGRCAEYAQIEGPLAIRGIPLLEDAAEALGSSLDGKRAGAFGRAAILSFNGNKIMTTSGGGMLLSDDLDLVSRCRYLSTQARQPVPYYEHTEIGYNYRLSNVLAALGRGQLTRLDDMMYRRRRIRQRYQESLGQIEGVRILGHDGGRDDSHDNCWLTSIVLDPKLVVSPADSVIKALNEEGVEARHLWKPLHMQPMFHRARTFLSGSSEQLFRAGLSLPSGSGMTDTQVQRVIKGTSNIVA